MRGEFGWRVIALLFALGPSAACDSDAAVGTSDGTDAVAATDTVPGPDAGVEAETTQPGETTSAPPDDATTWPEHTDDPADPGCVQAEDFVIAGSPGGTYAAPFVTATCTDDEVVVSANGIPDFTFTQVTPNRLTAQNHTWRFPRHPAIAAAPSAIPLVGAAAVAIDGLPIFGPTEAPRDGSRDPFLDEILDFCNGHTAPGGVYHFHARPECLIAGREGTPYLVLGYAFDGFPILGPWVCDDAACTSVREVQSGWEQVEASYGATIEAAWDAHRYVEGRSELDRCNGMLVDGLGYAYFATDTFPYLMGCYRGTPTANRVGP